jgi:5-bromo-4-chloroindolyl phosphate hydrolysis protein
MAKIKKMKIPKIKKAPKALFLYIFLLPMFISTIASLLSGDYIKFVVKLIGFAMLYGATKLIDSGLVNEYNYNQAEIAQAPKHKNKLWGDFVLLIALLFIGLLATKLNPINVVFTAIIGAVGAYLYYGKDPSVDKIPKDSSINYTKLIKDINEAKEKLEFIDNEKDKIKDSELKMAIDKASNKAHEILDTIMQDPKDIAVARKFMVVYLDGVKDVISQYNDIDKELLDSSYRDRLIELLIDASERFEKEIKRLKSNEIFDLDVQIDALKEQLKH